LIGTLKGHTDRVNSIRWIPNGDDVHFGAENELVSGGVDGNVIVWRRTGVDSNVFKQYKVLKEHEQTVTSVATIANKNETYIACTSADGIVTVWYRNEYDGEFKVDATLNFGNKMMECLDITFLPNSDIPVLVTGGLDHLIHVFFKENNTFNKVCVLPGHEDWIRSMEFTTLDESSVMLATASQDYRVRLWKFTERFSDDILLNMTNVTSKKGFSLSKTGHVVKSNDRTFTIIFEALLTGHEDWVHSVNWHPKIKQDDKVVQPLKLLTSSMDRSMMIWAPHEESGIWVDQVRMGEFGGLSGLFGQMGYYGGYFAPSGRIVMGHGYHGSFYLWKMDDDNEWRPHVTVSGHSQPVMDLSWDTAQNYFVSTSHDQSTRLFAQWTNQSGTPSWHEIGRPQVHGHDLECLSFVRGKKEHVIVTGAAEKVLRVFEAPFSFLKSLENIAGVHSDNSMTRALGAAVPALGLSNKPIQMGDSDPSVKGEFGSFDEGDDEMPVFRAVELFQPPFEQALLQNTLWPEIQKLYGHPNELVTVTSNTSGSVIASACSAKQADIAAIRIWDTDTWREIDVLQGHTLTVTQIAFSPNDEYMLSVSRDRHVILYEKTPLQDKFTYTPVIKTKASERIIWGCSWSHDSKLAVIGSRDKTIKVYRMDDIETAKKVYQEYATLKAADKKKAPSPLPIIGSLTFDSGVTACEFVDFSRYNNQVVPNQQYIFAVGLESGDIVICRVDEALNTCEIVTRIDTDLCHVEDVKRLRWRQVHNSNSDTYSWQLASCSTDHSIRLFNVLDI
jgi:elongator complex protein 2